MSKRRLARAIRRGARSAMEKHQRRQVLRPRSDRGLLALLAIAVVVAIIFFARWARAADGISAAPPPTWLDAATGVFCVLVALTVAAFLGEVALYLLSLLSRKDRP
jgi:hypothetical protein